MEEVNEESSTEIMPSHKGDTPLSCGSETNSPTRLEPSDHGYEKIYLHAWQRAEESYENCDYTNHKLSLRAARGALLRSRGRYEDSLAILEPLISSAVGWDHLR